MKNTRHHLSTGKITEVGSGNAVFLLQRAPNQTIVDQLGRRFRVVAIEVGTGADLTEVAGTLAEAGARTGISKYSLLADSDLAPVAIAHAIESADSVETLILIAPQTIRTNGAAKDLPLEEIKPPTLVLFGTRDEVTAPETGRIYARRIPCCFYTLVYDAGHDICANRPEALLSVVCDFLDHREKFVVPAGSSAISP
ncbi:MAG: hypothetical protein JO121_06605 [Deltaproteobacteria bacterium]|nr:hypothetical protein [Deltaproteobacteria bacterium]